MAGEIIRSKTLKPVRTTYCPGCLHSMNHKLIAECLDELGYADKAIMVLCVGCSTMSLSFYELDKVQAAHGRAPAVATGIKRVQPESLVITYQGDGDLASIGLSEIMYAANRGEKISVIFANNSTYGMTGGQLAPTTLVGQVATTAPCGRNPETEGYPIDMCKLLSQLEAPSYIERVALNTPANVRKAKAAIKKAFQNQIDGKPFSFVEVMINCVTNWGTTPLESLQFMQENTIPVYPLGVYRDK